LPTTPTEFPSPELPKPEPKIQPPPSDDAPPIMPDDDPFKDDPPAPGPEPTTPGASATDKQTRRTMPAIERAAIPDRRHWRAVVAAAPATSRMAAAAVDAAEPMAMQRPAADAPPLDVAMSEAARLTRVPAGGEPHFVSPLDDRSSQREVLPRVAPARQNPLRLATATLRDEQVVSAAASTVNEREMTAQSISPRRNPLRAN
jgi:hypothetical protein